jgi:hypothetical protein
MRTLRTIVVGLLFLGIGPQVGRLAAAPPGPTPSTPAPAAERFGQVDFPISCKADVQRPFERAVAILHSFWFERARSELEKVAAADPGCAMAYWGIAMTWWHPLWAPPDPESLAQGAAAAAKAQSLGGGTPLERELVAAISAYYHDAKQRDPHQRAVAYEHAMETAYRDHPKNVEVACFYALSLDATALPGDTTLANQKKAGAILEKIFEEHPDHPGAAHYLIHSYDYPSLARRALPAARRYAKIAPAAAHALHMPSHIFTRLGLWQDSVDSNLASMAAARAAQRRGEAGRGDELHAMGFLSYAYLQLGEYHAARGVLDRVKALAAEPAGGRGGGAKAKEAAVAVQIGLETHDWPAAEGLAAPEGAGAESEALVAWAQALGAARLKEPARAREAVSRLQALYDGELAEDRTGSGVHTGEVELEEARAWLAWAEGKPEDAVTGMKAIVAKVAAGGAEAMSYPPVLPAREQLGDLLLAEKRPEEALAEYEAVLAAAPHRFAALHGAARAAEVSGDHAKANEYFKELAELGAHGDEDVPALEEAHAYLSNRE